MGMRPEEMERWGAASIFKESARLLHKHYRLFLPFVLAFYLPISIFTVFRDLVLSPSSRLLPFASIGVGSVNTAQTTDPPGKISLTTIFFWAIVFLIYVVGTLGTGAVFYITDYLYTPTPTEDDRSIVPKVVKFLPRTFLRMFITQLWTVLVYCLLYVILGGIIYAITAAAADWSDLSSLPLLVLLPTGAASIYLVFALAHVITVLEPGNYGREALKRSTRLARIGRVWTIVAVTLTRNVLSAVWEFPKNGIMTGRMPVWVKVLGVVIAGLDSVFGVYLQLVSVVMYFVYKARFDAAGSARIPVFQRMDSAEHSYDPIVEGKGLVNRHKLKTLIGEP